MSIREKILYTVICDDCWKDAFSEWDYSAFIEKESALDSCLDFWYETCLFNSNNHRCPECLEKIFTSQYTLWNTKK